MTQQLRDELARIAEQAPTAHVPADAWSRGRRARRRDRLVAGAAALTLVLVLGGVAALLVDPSSRIAPAAPPDDQGAAVPSTIYPVPEHVQEADALTSDLAIGQGALAFVTDDRDLPVVVSASDGSYAVLDLPGWPWTNADRAPTLNSSTMQPLALSPDGTRLAWGYDDSQGTGIRVADLETGSVDQHPLRGTEFPGPKLSVTSVAFSGDSGDVAWSGSTDDPVASWYGYLSTPDGWTRELGPVEEPVTVAIGDDGRTLTYTNGFARIPSLVSVGLDDSFDTDDLEQPTPVASFSPSGELILFGSALQQGHVDVGSIADERVLRRDLSTDDYPDGAFVDPLGWLDDETAVVLARAEDGSDRDLAHVALMGMKEGSGYEVVTRSESYTADVTVAVDLLDRPTVDRPAPDWPWSPGQKLSLAGFALVGLLLIGLLAARRRRSP